jgi:NhaA family Na+:H+ antiporter
LAPRPTLEFLRTEAGGGAALAASAVLALALANSPLASDYFDLIGAPFTVAFGGYVETLSVRDWVGQGLMSVFFFVVGLEIKQELLKGEFSSPRKLALPIAAAVGGMIGPALVYLALNLGQSGGAPAAWLTPTATDIAFALAAFALVSRGLPESLRVFLLTVAIADDLGAIVMVAVLYTGQLHAWAIAAGAATLLGLIGLSEWRDAPFLFRAVGFIALAAFTLKSGVSTSLAGVAAAFTVPIGSRRPGQEGVLKHFMQSLHPYVAYAILPLFAFTAAGISFGGLRLRDVLAPAPLGVAAGLFLGKQAGVLITVFALVRTGLARRPTGANWLELYGVALLCGVGFTLSLFIGALAFAGGGELARSQMTLGVVVGSVASALAGMGVLALAGRLRRPV